MPSVETGVTFGRVLRGNFGLVEIRVLRVLQLGFGETLIVVNGTIAYELNLGNSGNRLEVRM